MSHFNVAVFSRHENDIDELLAPYCEVVDAESSFAEFVEDEDGQMDATIGKKGFWHNPDARWDWYTVGGRWAGQLKLLPGKTGEYGSDYGPEERNRLREGYCDSALVTDCDFSPDEQTHQQALRFWEVAVEGKPMTDEEKKKLIIFYKGEYYLQQYGSKEQYAKDMSDFSTYAFITADGEWYETGHMGWWGVDDATRESRDTYRTEFEAYLEKAKEQGLYITIVDCHI